MRLLPVLPAALCVVVSVSAVAPNAWADTPVVIEGVDEEMAESIRDLLPDRDRPTSLFDAERIAEEAAARALAWLRSEGYYAATVEPEARDDPAQARLVLTPGPLFRFASPAVDYHFDPPDDDAAERVLRAIRPVHEGAPARAAAVLQAEADAVAALQQEGYADAQANERRVLVDHATSLVTTEFRFAAGNKAVLGDIRAEPDDVFRSSFVDRLQNWDDGEVYTPQSLAQLRRDLTSTGAVSLATTTLAPAGEDGRRDVIINLEPARRHAYEVGVSYSTTEGAGVQGKWTRRNLTRRADSLSIEATLAELQQGVTAAWLRPHAAGLGHSITLGASAEREAIDAYTRQGVAIYGSVDASTHLRVGQSYGVRLSWDEYDDLSGGVGDALVLSGFASLRNDSTGFSLDPRDGSVAEFRIEPSVSTGDETLGFVRATAEGRIYESFGDDDHITLAARLRTGWLEPVSGSVDDVPPDRRFYAGGGGSVRGYSYNSIYPRERDDLGLAPGGEGLLEGSLEARYRFDERWGVATFVDGGNAFDSWSDAADLRWGAGVGLRYNLGFAPLRVDIAVPLDPVEGDEDYALYISLGQAF